MRKKILGERDTIQGVIELPSKKEDHGRKRVLEEEKGKKKMRNIILIIIRIRIIIIKLHDLVQSKILL